MTAYLLPLTGGILIGISALLMFGLLGRITGISGIFCGVLNSGLIGLWRWAFLAGLIGSPVVLYSVSEQSAPAPSDAGLPLLIIAGLLVGFGTRFGGGCTSGHGVCGIGRLSPRSIIATIAFMLAGIATVFIARHLIGGAL